MKDIQYIDILKQSFLLTWKNKFLWFFGFLITLGSISYNWSANSESITEEGKKIEAVSVLIQNNPHFFASLSAILAVVAIVFFVLRIMAVAGIVKAANDINLYRQLSLIAILKEAKRYLGRLLLLELLIGVALFAITLVLAVPVVYLFAVKAILLAFLMLVAAVAIIVPLAILAYYLHRYASFYIILTNEKLRMSLELAYAVFSKNIKESLLMGLALVATIILLATGVIFLWVLLAIIFMPLGFLAYLIFAETAVIVFSTIAIVVYVSVAVTALSWYASFLQTAWLLFFRQIASEKHDERKIPAKVDVEGKVPNPEVV